MTRFNLLAVFFMMVLLGPYIGQYAYLSVKKYVIQKTAEERYERKEEKEGLIHFRLSQEEVRSLDWEHDREFEFNGQMYDVIEECQLADSVDLWCWLDKQETLLGIRIKTLLSRWTGAEDGPVRSTQWVDWQEVKYINIDLTGLLSIDEDLAIEANTSSFSLRALLYSGPPPPPPRFSA